MSGNSDRNSEKTNDVSPLPARGVPVAQGYIVLCGASLAVVLVALYQRELGLFGLAALATGMLGLLTRLRLTPLLFLIILAAEILWQHLTQGRRVSLDLDAGNLLLAAGATAFVMGHFRLQGVVKPLLPMESASREGGSPRPVSGDELTRFAALAVIMALLAQLAWLGLQHPPRLLGLTDAGNRLVLVVWLGGVAALVASALLGHWRRRQMSPEEADLYLQDIAWQQTRSEQRRWQRAAIRQRVRRKEKP